MMDDVIPFIDLETTSLKPCATVDDPFTSDLTWLMRRAVRVFTDDFDAVRVEVGLKDMRDTHQGLCENELSALRTQLAAAHQNNR